jgi:SnoaL-like protein
LIQLMTNDHVLIDSLGHRLSGWPEALREAWAGYFGMVPDYQIKAKAIFARGNTVVIVGVASGCYVATPSRDSLGTWETPGAWRAVVRHERVAEWQVYADNEPIRALMRRASTGTI